MNTANGTTLIRPSNFCNACPITAERGYGDRLLCPTGDEVGVNEEVKVQEELEEESRPKRFSSRLPPPTPESAADVPASIAEES